MAVIQRDWEHMTVRERQIESMIKRTTDTIPREQRVRVLPRDDEIRNALVHPNGFLAFPPTGSVEWPLDNFTQRRLRDGTVFIDGPAPPEAAHNLSQREVAYRTYLTDLAKRYRARAGDREAVYDIDTAQHPGELAHRVDAAHPVGTVVREENVRAGEYPLSSTRADTSQPHVRGYGAYGARAPTVAPRQARVTTTDVRRQTVEAREMIASRRAEMARQQSEVAYRDSEVRREPMVRTPPATQPQPAMKPAETAATAAPTVRTAAPARTTRPVRPPRPASADVPTETPSE